MRRDGEYENCYYRFRDRLLMYVSGIDFSEKAQKENIFVIISTIAENMIANK